MAVILVVDDEAEIRSLIERVLVQEGHQVEVAVDGAAALIALRSRAYDLVVCNVRMPVMDGPTLYAQILELNPWQASRFVFCTGDIVSPDVRAFLLSTRQPVLAKPFSITSLRDTVNRFLGELPGPHYRIARQAEEHLAASTYPF